MKSIGALLVLGLSLTASSKVLVHGHRGARAVLPENTLPAFEYAIETGVDVLELDMAVTRDNVLVISHDPFLSPKICKGPEGSSNVIRELTLEQLKQWDCGVLQNPAFPHQKPVPGTTVPTLDEVFSLAPNGSFEFNIETKIFKDKPELTPPPDEFARLVVDAVRRHQLESRVIVQSFDFRTLREVKKLAPEIRLSALYAVGVKRFAQLADESGATIVSPHYRLVIPGRVVAAHKAGLQVVPWTVNTPREWQRMIEAHVDAIITDDPAALIAWLKENHLR